LEEDYLYTCFHGLGDRYVDFLYHYILHGSSQGQRRIRPDSCLGKPLKLIKYNEKTVAYVQIQCWIGAIHRWERLYLHYVYIFLAQIGSIIIYTFIIFFLHGQVYSHFRHLPSTTQASEGEVPDNKKKHDTFAISRQRILQTTRYMALYPITYVSLTLPLAATRICAMAGRRPPVEVYIFAGLMMTSCGWVDVLLYVTTRKVLISSKVTAKPGRSPWRRLYS
jgi:hypothetical protein